MPIWDHLDELRERVLVAALAGLVAVLTCFCFSKDLVVFLEAPVVGQGVKFLQLSPGEFFFTTLQVMTSAQVLVWHPCNPQPSHQVCVPGCHGFIASSALQRDQVMTEPEACPLRSHRQTPPRHELSRLHTDHGIDASTANMGGRWLAMRGSCWLRRRFCTRSSHTWCPA